MYHTKTAQEVVREFKTSVDSGLSTEEHEVRILEHGKNVLPEPKKETLVLLFIKQFIDFLIILLIIAAAISLALGEVIDALAIFAIVIVNATIGFVQEYKAEKAIEALKKMSASYTKVIRSGELIEVETATVVPGDIILLEAGDKVPADARIIEALDLQVSEAALTGESIAARKTTEPIANPNITLADRTNMLFKDTSIISGKAKAVVTATGINTEVGKIALSLRDEKSPQTPLQLELDKVGRSLTVLALVIIALIFLLEIINQTTSLKNAFESSISLAVAAIPEGLPAVITIVLAIGVTRLAKKKAIIRRLDAVETLGSVTHILTDKTGTLTQNKIVVTNIFLSDGQEFYLDGEGYNPVGNFYNSTKTKVHPGEHYELVSLLEDAVLVSDAVLNSFNNRHEVVGDPTEGALVVALEKAGIKHKELRAERKRIFEIPFSSDYKFMAAVHETKNAKVLLVKGAPEILLAMCRLTEQERQNILKRTNELAAEGLRTLAFGKKILSDDEFIQLSKTKELPPVKFEGLISQKDPLRKEVKNAIAIAKTAGVTTIMVTGDHKLTAASIAKELGLITTESETLDGEQLANFSDEEVKQALLTVRVFARVSPEQKLRLVKLLHLQRGVVAVTGDGVNDAPAIKAADIGVAMGIEGTDVSREASSMVLANDNYATIVDAIQEGRVIYDNFVKFITYLISCNLAEIFVVAAVVALRAPLPLVAIQLLWINLVTDGLPSLALGMEQGEADIMTRKPRKTGEPILTKERWLVMGIQGLCIGIYCVFTYFAVLPAFGVSAARTATFLAITFAEFMQAFNSRSELQSLFKIHFWQNKVLLYVIAGSILIHIPIIFTQAGQMVFSVVRVNLIELEYIVGSVVVTFLSSELIKLIRAKAHRLAVS